eukprot:449154_1
MSYVTFSTVNYFIIFSVHLSKFFTCRHFTYTMFNILKRTRYIQFAAVIFYANGNQIENNTDVLIIGGGIVGSSAAYCLSKHVTDNINITLLERNCIGSGSSSLSAGTIYCAGYGNYSSILSTFCMDTMNLLKEIDKKGYDIELVQNGAIKIATSETQKNDIYQTYLNSKQNGYDVEYINSLTRIKNIEPYISNKVIACLHSPQSAHVNPGKATIAIADAAQQNGVTIYENTSVVNINPITDRYSNYKYIVKTECGTTFHCKHVIIASGAWCSNTDYGLNISIPVVPVKESYSFWKRHSSRNDEYNIPEFCTHDKDNNALVNHSYGRQTVDGNILFGGSRIKADSCNDFEIIKDDINKSIEYVQNDILPVVNEYNVSGYWCGIMPFSRDGMPLVGELDTINLNGVYLLCGFGPKGIMEGPGAAQYIANIIVNKENGHELNIDQAAVVHPCRPNCVQLICVI